LPIQKLNTAQPSSIGKFWHQSILCKMASAIPHNSWNCHKFNCALAIHENVLIFAIFCHIIILFQSGLISYIWGKYWKNSTNSLIAQQPQNTPQKQLDDVIAHTVVYIIFRCCEVLREIGVGKVSKDD
jgi:hypothetical protein